MSYFRHRMYGCKRSVSKERTDGVAYASNRTSSTFTSEQGRAGLKRLIFGNNDHLHDPQVRAGCPYSLHGG